jgi:hypothetical protein
MNLVERWFAELTNKMLKRDTSQMVIFTTAKVTE